MTFLTGLFIIILGGMAVGAITEVAKAIGRRGVSASELSDLRQQLEQNLEELEEARTTLAHQGAQLTELQERLDFAERMLTQARDRGALGADRDRK